MKKTGSNSILSKYSDGSIKSKKKGVSKPLMTEYEQRYKGDSLSRTITEPQKRPTLDEKIAARTKKKEPEDTRIKKVSVEIAGNRYLLGSTDDMSEARIRRIAALVNEILSNSKENNPGLTNSKVTTLALIDACDRIISLSDNCTNMKTELMYLQQQIRIEEEQHPVDPTPLEEMAKKVEGDKDDQ